MDFFSILKIVGGLSLFLYGMNIMGDSLKALAGGKLESILAKLTNNKFVGFLLGLGVTAVIQSSSATMVMLVGFVNSGIMRLGQTISILMGANIGTTVTAWLLSTTSISGDSFFLRILKPSSFTPILALVGIIMVMASKSDKRKNVGSIMLGFAVLMFGMETMSGIDLGPGVTKFLTMFENPIMGIIVGMVLTVIIQSSSASVGILQALSTNTIIPFSIAIPIVLGENIGAAITPVLSSISGNRKAKQVACAAVYIKLIGVAVFAVVFYSLVYAIDLYGMIPENATPFTIAIFHTSFNIFSTVILMPFCKGIEKLSARTIKDKEDPTEDLFSTLDDRFLAMGSFAVEKSRELVCQMSERACKAVIDSTSLLDKYDEKSHNSLLLDEEIVDKFEDKISTYLVKLSAKNLSEKDSHEVTELLHCIGDFERISDHSVNIAKVAKEISDKGIVFSDEALSEIKTITKAVSEILELTDKAFCEDDLEIAKNIEPLEQVIDKLNSKIKSNHIQRLQEGGCTIELGFVLSDLLTNYERISDHCSNIAVCLLEIANNSFETHEYLSHVKTDGENEFFEKYEGYKEKYSI